jgi:hypothetical protein
LPRLAPVIRLIFSGDLGAFGQCVGYGLGFAGAGEAAHADGHAVLDQSGGVSRAHPVGKASGYDHGTWIVISGYGS